METARNAVVVQTATEDNFFTEVTPFLAYRRLDLFNRVSINVSINVLHVTVRSSVEDASHTDDVDKLDLEEVAHRPASGYQQNTSVTRFDDRFLLPLIKLLYLSPSNLAPPPLHGAATWRIKRHDPRAIVHLFWEFHEDSGNSFL